MLTVASFFSGIGGIDLAFAWAGFDIRFQCEIDPYCQQVLKKWRVDYFPNAVIKGDIREVTKREVGKVDVIVGGFPCQDISIAGKREGIRRGNRSGLWFELLRIIRTVRPKVILLENVAAIAVPTDDGQPAPGLIVTATLAEIGYDCMWQFVRASDIGAPHQRERWFCIAYHVGDGERRRYTKPRTTSERPYHIKRHTENRQRIQVECPPESASKVLPGTGQYQGRNKLGYARRGKPSQRGITSRANTKHATPRFTGVNRGVMGDTNGNGLQGQTETRNAPGSGTRGKQLTSRPGYGTGKQLRAKSRLGRTAYGLSRRMDRHNGQFPARPNEPQYAYEPSRVTDVRLNRVARIKALGNAVVPQVVYPFAMAIKSFLEAA
jgi:DNA (cytosine-5)-methyltransferase 1